MPIQHQAITWTNADPIHWRIYAAQRGLRMNYISNANAIIWYIRVDVVE